MRRGLWVSAVALVVAAAISVGYAFLPVTPIASAVLLDDEFQDGFIQPDVSLSYDGY
jgi:hypothetical protein